MDGAILGTIPRPCCSTKPACIADTSTKDFGVLQAPFIDRFNIEAPVAANLETW